MDCLAAAGPEKAVAIFETFTVAVKDRSEGAPLPTYVYCSGHYVMARGYGGLDKWTDERQPAEAPVNKGTIWRKKIEVPVLTSKNYNNTSVLTTGDKVNGIVVRPTCLYGKSGSYFAMYHFDPAFKAVEKGEKEFETICSDNGKISTIHTDDLADLFVRAAERVSLVTERWSDQQGGICRGQVFVASNPSTDNIRDIADGIVRVTGLKGWKKRDPADAYETAWITPVLQKPTLATALTGWTPRKMGVSDGIDVYWVGNNRALLTTSAPTSLQSAPIHSPRSRKRSSRGAIIWSSHYNSHGLIKILCHCWPSVAGHFWPAEYTVVVYPRYYFNGMRT